MSRYKDVDKILEAMDTWPKYGCNPDGRFLELTKETEADYVPYVHYDDMVKAVMGTPVQDVAPVVRCKDCVYGEIDDPDFPNQYLCHYYGDIWNDGVHFCSNGEIRNDR